MKKIYYFFIGLFIFILSYPFILKQLNRQKISFPSKTCLITGASSGIGLQIAKQMLKKDWRIIGVARRINKLEELQKELGQNFIPYQCDVGDYKQVCFVSDSIKQKNLNPTLFFLNAGTGDVEKEFFFDLHKKTFDVNYFGIIFWIEQWLDFIKKIGGGAFVATSSVSSLFATPGSAAYSASKVALNNCFQSLRLKYLNNNIDFIIVMPGPVDTAMLKGVDDLPFIQTPKETAKYIVEHVFDGEQVIEPSWFYSTLFKIFNWLPDSVASKIFG